MSFPAVINYIFHDLINIFYIIWIFYCNKYYKKGTLKLGFNVQFKGAHFQLMLHWIKSTSTELGGRTTHPFVFRGRNRAVITGFLHHPFLLYANKLALNSIKLYHTSMHTYFMYVFLKIEWWDFPTNFCVVLREVFIVDTHKKENIK